MATIVNPDHRPQMATVRSGVMQKAIYDGACKKEVVYPEVSKYVSPEAFVVKVLDHHVEAAKHNLKGAPIVVAGGYGMGSKENFDLLFDLAKVRSRPSDWSDWCHRSSEGVYRLRYLRADPAHRWYAGFWYHHLCEQRPRCAYQQDCRLRDCRYRGRGSSQTH